MKTDTAEHHRTFYFFHHLPKCGGTSLGDFLQSIFVMHKDYLKGNSTSNPEGFKVFQNSAIDLTQLGPNDCISGHYNIPGIYLWERYPELATLDVRMFSILRDPFEAAKSGVRFGITRGIYKEGMSAEQKTRFVLRRSNFLSKTLGIKEESQIEDVFDRYWFVAPLDKIDTAAKIISLEVGKPGPAVSKINTTKADDNEFTADAEGRFRDCASLDIKIFETAVSRFDKFLAGASLSHL